MKTINFNHVTERLKEPDTTLPEHEYEHYVKLTSLLIKRSYMQTAKLVEKWPLDKIKRRYWDCKKDSRSKIPPDVRWWAMRKREVSND
jgi:hypothetical protein